MPRRRTMSSIRSALLAAFLVLLAPELGARSQEEAATPLDDAALDARAELFFGTLAAAIDGRGADAHTLREWFGEELRALVSEEVLVKILTEVAGPGDVRLERLIAPSTG